MPNHRMRSGMNAEMGMYLSGATTGSKNSSPCTTTIQECSPAAARPMRCSAISS